MQKTIKEIKDQVYNGKVSYSITFEDGTNGLLTNSTLMKEFGGNLPSSWVVGGAVEVAIEEVQKKGGGGTWNAVSPVTATNTPAPSQQTNYAGTPQKSSKDYTPWSALINTSLMSAVSFHEGKPSTEEQVLKTFNDFLNGTVSAFNVLNK